jgi:hypothetical protein
MGGGGDAGSSHLGGLRGGSGDFTKFSSMMGSEVRTDSSFMVGSSLLTRMGWPPRRPRRTGWKDIYSRIWIEI